MAVEIITLGSKDFFSNSECCRLTFVRAGPKGETESCAAADNR